MSKSTWNGLTVVLLTAPLDDSLDSAAWGSVDAVVVESASPQTTALERLLRQTSVPVVVVADIDPEVAARLIEIGADDVLPQSAGLREIARAVRHAVARARRAAHQVPSSTTAGARAAGGSPPAAQPVPPPADTPAPSDSSRDVSPASTKPAPASAIGAVPRTAPGPDMPPQLRAVGRLAGGVAHDFNNLLQIIGGNAEVLLHDLDSPDSRRTAAEAIVDAARRAAMLTHQLLAFGRRQTLIPSPVDLSALVSDAISSLRTRVGNQIRIATQLAAGLPKIEADRAQLLEVLSNLAENASEAMPDGGTLTIATDIVEVDDEMRRSRPWLREGQFVRLQVNDTGAGIEEQALPHLFEPFFTTKTQWSGTGLGLSSVYGIIKQSGGFIWIDSHLGEGTRITILLPTATMSPANTPAPNSRGRVLLVEDDEAVRELLEGVLSHYGFTVTSYATAEDALEHTQAFDLLLTDVLLPGLNGPELAKAIRRRFPEVPVLFMSGDTGHVIDPKDVDARGFLQKPFSAHTLVARVDELIKAPRQARAQRGE